MDQQEDAQGRQYSPDGRWWWDGTQWVSIEAPPQEPAFMVGAVVGQEEDGSEGASLPSVEAPPRDWSFWTLLVAECDDAAEAVGFAVRLGESESWLLRMEPERSRWQVYRIVEAGG